MKKLLLLCLLSGSLFAQTVTVKINPPQEYDFKTRDQIFAKRIATIKKYPKLFSRPYSPSNEVFGQVVDNKPWWGFQGILCKGPGKNSIAGLSEESRFINNPFVLVGIDDLTAHTVAEGNATCPDLYPAPTGLKVDLKKRKMTATFRASPYVNYVNKPVKIGKTTWHGSFKGFNFTGRNARDLGYNYAFVSASKNVKFLNSNNVSTGVYQFKDFVHVGNSCGYPGGCNNGSPDQPELHFSTDRFPASATFKLWKEKPASPNDTPDITFEVVIN